MVMDWRPFYRKASPGHMLEAKIAIGGEPYSHTEHPLAAKPGQWLCRNPDNGHTWVMSEEGMEELYRPVNGDDPEWIELVEKVQPKKKKKKGSADDPTKKTSASFSTNGAGPLFFGEDENEDEEEPEEG